MITSLIGLGSNQGDRSDLLRRALEEISAYPSIREVRCSRLHRTRPAGGPVGQQEFLNAAARLETSLDPNALLTALRTVEERLGRRRAQRWGTRTIDLDLLLYDELVFQSEQLTVPHPRMAYRRFVLEPAVEVAADLVHPPTGWTLQRLLEHLNGAADYIAVTGPPGVPTRELVEQVARRGGVRLLQAPRSTSATVRRPLANSGGSRQQLLLELSLEELQRRACILENLPLFEIWQGTPVVALSDFWIGEWPSLTGTLLQSCDADQRPSVDLMWQRETQHVTPPKLLVMLDGTVEQRRAYGLAGGENRAIFPDSFLQDVFSEDLRRRLWEQVERYHQGPVLRLDAWPLEVAVAEVSAAIEAIRIDI